MDRRRILQGFAGVIGALAGPVRAQASYPVKPVRLVVPFAPGGGIDTLARTIATPLADALGQPFIVENRPGGGTVIGAEFVAKAAPDGYTLLVTSVPHVTNPSLVKPMPFDTVKAFAPVSLVVQSPFVLVVPPTSAITSLQSLAEVGKSGKLSFGSSGAGTADRLGMELLASELRVPMVHIAYKGSALAMTDLMGGHIDLMLANVVAAAPHLKAGKLRGIAVTTTRRSQLLPDMPTIAELTGKPFDVSAWTGVLAPAGTDPAIVDTLAREMRKAIGLPAMREFLLTSGAEAVSSTPAEFRSFVESEIAKWGEIIRAAGIT